MPKALRSRASFDQIRTFRRSHARSMIIRPARPLQTCQRILCVGGVLPDTKFADEGFGYHKCHPAYFAGWRFLCRPDNALTGIIILPFSNFCYFSQRSAKSKDAAIPQGQSSSA